MWAAPAFSIQRALNSCVHAQSKEKVMTFDKEDWRLKRSFAISKRSFASWKNEFAAGYEFCRLKRSSARWIPLSPLSPAEFARRMNAALSTQHSARASEFWSCLIDRPADP